MTCSSDRDLAPATPDDVTALILRIFRANGALLAAGDQLVDGLGLTSARWQLLGGIADCEEPQSVAQLAREIGVTRQSVQRIANELESEGVIAYRPNPRHKRAQLVELTSHGREVFEKSMTLQRPWAAGLGRKLTSAQVTEVCKTLDALLTTLKEDGDATAGATDADVLPGTG
ncbi:MarR family transcriptional regulator [Tianweitania sp. BSSL-BM11]|uniref:MarR family transcriptional regulator n=1 Tax=Tianweitania aestuarii TaxID=2814886 RepID=A0ABS5RY84_9HYPH|nr:MarR family transcriptional regulator [Tianweitania aestuarii]MBS9721976.1 MarR family transcriptional regulator [Tianweitania aestuarii]